MKSKYNNLNSYEEFDKNSFKKEMKEIIDKTFNRLESENVKRNVLGIISSNNGLKTEESSLVYSYDSFQGHKLCAYGVGDALNKMKEQRELEGLWESYNKQKKSLYREYGDTNRIIGTEQLILLIEITRKSVYSKIEKHAVEMFQEYSHEAYGGKVISHQFYIGNKANSSLEIKSENICEEVYIGDSLNKKVQGNKSLYSKPSRTYFPDIERKTIEKNLYKEIIRVATLDRELTKEARRWLANKGYSMSLWDLEHIPYIEKSKGKGKEGLWFRAYIENYERGLESLVRMTWDVLSQGEWNIGVMNTVLSNSLYREKFLLGEDSPLKTSLSIINGGVIKETYKRAQGVFVGRKHSFTAREVIAAAFLHKLGRDRFNYQGESNWADVMEKLNHKTMRPLRSVKWYSLNQTKNNSPYDLDSYSAFRQALYSKDFMTFSIVDWERVVHSEENWKKVQSLGALLDKQRNEGNVVMRRSFFWSLLNRGLELNLRFVPQAIKALEKDMEGHRSMDAGSEWVAYLRERLIKEGKGKTRLQGVFK